MVATLQGLVARSSAEQIYIHPQVGGYETWLTVAHTEKDSSPKLVDTLMRLFAKLRD